MLSLLTKPLYLGLGFPSWQELHLKHGIVVMTNHDEIKTSRHRFLFVLAKRSGH